MNHKLYWEKSRLSALFAGLILIMSAFPSCETQASLTRKRIKSVERGLLEAIVFEGQKPEKIRLLERMQYYRVPGVSIAVLDNLQIEWAKAYGTLEQGRSAPVTTESLFQAASVSQTVVALAAMDYMEQGRLSLDEDVNTALRSWRIPENVHTRQEKVTLRRLLSHTAGVNVPEFTGYGAGEPLPSLGQVLNGQEPAGSPPVRIILPPGSERRYSEGGYAVVQQLLEDLGERPFAEIMEEAILGPSGMAHSTFTQPLPPEFAVQASAGHSREGEPLEGRSRVFPEAAAAGLWSTPKDLAQFMLMIMETALGRSQGVASPDLARTMLSPQTGNQGLAFFVDDSGENFCFHLQGHKAGFACALVAYPSRGQGAVVMANSENGSFLIDEILRGVAEVYRWPHLKPEVRKLFRLNPSVYAQYVGRYEVTPEYVLGVTHEDYYLVIQPAGQAPTKFFVESQAAFFSTGPYIHIRFVFDDEGEVSGLVLTQGGQAQRAVKIE